MRKLVVAGTVAVLVLALGACSDPEATPEAPPQSAASAPLRTAAVDHYRAQFKVEGDVFTFVASTPVASRLPTWRGRAPVRAWRFQARDADAKLLHEDTLDDPRLVRGEFHDDKGDHEIDPHHLRLTATEFLLRVPRGTTSVDFYDGKRPLGRAELPAGGAP
jgi:hypothetical protein